MIVLQLLSRELVANVTSHKVEEGVLSQISAQLGLRLVVFELRVLFFSLLGRGEDFREGFLVLLLEGLHCHHVVGVADMEDF